MITAKDINNKKFEQARPGYSPVEVDDFLREIAQQITRYQKEKEETEKKMEVLVESVREYRNDEEALKDALIGAQRQGRQVIAEAQEKADGIIAAANSKANEIVGSTKIQLEKEKQNLTKMQKEVSEFKANLLAMYKSHLSQITSIPEYEDDEDEQPQEQSEKQPEEEKAAAFDNEETSDAEEPKEAVEQASEAEESQTPSFESSPFSELGAARSVSRFSDLKFGENRQA